MIKTKEDALKSLNLGMKHFYLKDYDVAVDHISESHNYFNDIKDIDNTVISLCELAMVYYHNNNSGFSKSISLLFEAKDIVDNNEHKVETRAKVFVYIGIINYNEKNFSDALKYYKFAEKILFKATDSMEFAKLLDNMAIFYLRSSNFQIATKYLIKSQEVKIRLGDKRELAITLLLLGRHFCNVENYGEATIYLNKVVEIFSEYNDYSNAARIQDELAKIYINLCLYTFAIDHCNKSLELAMKVNEPIVKAFSLCTLAHLEVLHKRPEDAIKIIKTEVQPIFAELLSTRGYANAVRILGLAYYHLQNYKEAIKLLKEAIKIFKDSEIYSEMARCLFELGDVYRYDSQKFMAISSYQLGLKIAHFNNLPILTKRIEDVLFEVDESEWADVINENARKDKSFNESSLSEPLDLDENINNKEKKLRISLYSLLKIGRALAAESNVSKLLAIIALETKKALRADRCTIFLYDNETDELYSKVALGMDNREIRINSKSGLAGHVFNTGETINIKDTYNDFRFNQEIDKKTGYKTQTILSIPMRNSNHEIIGVFQVLNKLDSDVFTDEDEDLLISISSSAGIALENTSLHQKQQRMFYEQKQSFESFIATLAASIDARDKITAGHSKRVTSYAIAISEQMGLSKEEIEVLEYAAILHDFGKIGIKDSVLCKRGKLTDEEYKHIQEHASITYEILKTMFFEEKFKNVPEIAASHHEKYNGYGYFRKLKGEDIPLEGRIIAISDVFDAITSKRHYRDCMPFLEVLNIIEDSAGSHFDGNIVEQFFQIRVDKIIEILSSRENNRIKVDEEDRLMFRKYIMSELYTFLKKTKDELFSEEKALINTFEHYYGNLNCDDVPISDN